MPARGIWWVDEFADEKHEQSRDGRAYGKRRGRPDLELVQTGPGTKGGELLRRYWQPIARSEEVGELPVSIKVMAEELILFRTKRGDCGLMYPRCIHRGASLLFGKIESEGIRCAYHGWLFDPEGRCLEAPCESAFSGIRKLRQPWYPVCERHGLIWAYLGPAEAEPPFPVLSITESLAEGEAIVAGGGINPPTGGLAPAFSGAQDFNWWQNYDNLMDPTHLYILHYKINGLQGPSFWAVPAKSEFIQTEDGVLNIQCRLRSDGTEDYRAYQAILPNIVATPCGNHPSVAAVMIWTVPRDDESFRIFSLAKVRRTNEVVTDETPVISWGPGKPALRWELEDHQRWQSDYIIMKSQGDITIHSEEHLSTNDRGLAMVRRLFRKAADGVARGDHPVGTGPVGPLTRKVISLEDALSLKAIRSQ